MADVTDVILPILQKIQEDIASMKGEITTIKADVASIKNAQRAHGVSLDTYSENFHDIIRLLRDMATAAELQRLAARVTALETVSRQ